MRVVEAQISFILGTCLGEGVTTGINLSESGDETGKTGSDPGNGEEQGGITPGEGTRGLEGDDEEYILTNQGEFTTEEMAQIVYQHGGEGDLPADRRPTYEQIYQTLKNARPRPIKGQNALRYKYKGVQVIINRDSPLRSTAFLA